MRLLNIVNLARKQVFRHPLRSALTILGVCTGMFLFLIVEVMNQAMHEATTSNAKDQTLVVYRENRFCPFTSRLPEHYENGITAIPGVTQVTPMKVVVNNCGTSLDVVTFRGVPADDLRSYSQEVISIREVLLPLGKAVVMPP